MTEIEKDEDKAVDAGAATAMDGKVAETKDVNEAEAKASATNVVNGVDETAKTATTEEGGQTKPNAADAKPGGAKPEKVKKHSGGADGQGEKKPDHEETDELVKPHGTDSAKSAAEAIERDLGVPAKAHYEFAVPLVTKSTNLEKLEMATERLVKALQAAPDEKSTTRGYGELALLYGRALLGFVVRGAAEGDILGSKANAGDDDEEEVEAEGDAGEEKEESVEELCWTQLEVARVAFEKSGAKERLCESIRTIGEFLLACDQASAAGEEFGSAAGMCVGRMKAECLYKRYLSLRRVSADEAKKSLEEAVKVLEEIEGTAEVVKEMKGELQALDGGEEGRGVKRVGEVTVMRVTPKRRK